MPTHHDDIALTAGDDWLIAGSLIDENGAPLDLSGVDMIQWVLLGADGMPALTPGVAIVAIGDDATSGLVNIAVPSSATKDLLPGRYVDAMRVVMSETSRSSVWQGIIGVDANPFDWLDNPLPLTVALTVAPEFVVGGSPEIGGGSMMLTYAPSDLAVDPESVDTPSLGAPTLG